MAKRSTNTGDFAKMSIVFGLIFHSLILLNLVQKLFFMLYSYQTSKRRKTYALLSIHYAVLFIVQ